MVVEKFNIIEILDEIEVIELLIQIELKLDDDYDEYH